ncbi:MAG: HTTM domain-containing protein [Verrucomicrobiae bacterium]|nr:HTTM domain-containing protein [Verrucomicrobiae bacterium]
MTGSNLLTRIVFDPKDERAYALVRIVFGCIAFLNICDLWDYRETLFSAAGIVPINLDGNRYHLSLFYFLQSSEAVTSYFLFSGMMALLLTFGIIPRVAAICVFVWQVSYSAQLGFVTYGADSAMRVYAFLIMVSPLGACWTIRNVLTKSPSPPAQVPGYGIVLMRIQLAVIYIDTTIVKLASEHWRNGEAFTYYMLSVYSRWKSPLFADWAWLSTACTYGALLLEFLLPILLFVRRTRMVAMFLGISLHLMIAVTSSNLLMFSLAMIPGYLSFLDGRELSQAADRFRFFRRTRLS